MSIFNDNEIIQNTMNDIISKWSDQYILSPTKFATIITRFKKHPTSIANTRNVFSTRFEIKDGTINLMKYLIRKHTTIVILNYDKRKLPDFIKFDDIIGEFIFVNCPNIVAKYLPEHIKCTKLNTDRNFIRELVIKNMI